MKIRLVEDTKIEVENPGLLEVPEGKKVYDLPVSHFKKLIDKKGREKVVRALTNLQVWNKNDDPKIASWAKKMKKSLEGYGEKKTKNESYEDHFNSFNRVTAPKEEDTYEIVYDYDSEDGTTEKDIHETFTGSWTELQDYIREMKEDGCYHIDANLVSPFDESLKESSLSNEIERQVRNANKSTTTVCSEIAHELENIHSEIYNNIKYVDIPEKDKIKLKRAETSVVRAIDWLKGNLQ